MLAGDDGLCLMRAPPSLRLPFSSFFEQLRRSVSRGQMSSTSDLEFSQQGSPEPLGHSLFLEEGSNVLLLKGALRRRFGTTP